MGKDYVGNTCCLSKPRRISDQVIDKKHIATQAWFASKFECRNFSYSESSCKADSQSPRQQYDLWVSLCSIGWNGIPKFNCFDCIDR